MQMCDGKNVTRFSIATVHNRVRKAINKGSSNSQLNRRANVGIRANEPDGALHFRGKQPAEPRNPRFVELSNGRKLGLRLGMK